MISGDLQAGDLVPPADLEGYFADEVNSAEFENRTLDYLNELSARRRLTTVFPNEQSPFYGAQLNYVNTREGNLTFLMRDVVRGARLPIVVGRVYDSRIRDGSDFGPGWKLSVAESLKRAVSEAGGTLYVISGYRSQSYQDHLREVWDKYQIVKDWPSGQCSDVRDNVEDEWRRHRMADQPAKISHHTAGNAFDASWSMLPQNVSIDTLAASCNLSRPLKVDDPYHFVYSN